MPEAGSLGWAAVNRENPLPSNSRHELKVDVELSISSMDDHPTTYSSASRKRSIEVIEISDSSSEGSPSPPRKLQRRSPPSETSIPKREITSPIDSLGTSPNQTAADRDGSSPPVSPCMRLPARRVQPRRCAKFPRSIESPNQRITRSTARNIHVCSSESACEDDISLSTPITSPCETDYSLEEEDAAGDTKMHMALTSSPPVRRIRFINGQAIHGSSSHIGNNGGQIAEKWPTAIKIQESEHYTEFITALEAAQKAGEGIDCYLELFEDFKAHLIKPTRSLERSITMAEALPPKGQEDQPASSTDDAFEIAGMQGSDVVVADVKSSKPGDIAIRNHRPQHSSITEEKFESACKSSSEVFQQRTFGERCSHENLRHTSSISSQYLGCVCLNLPCELRRCQYVEQLLQDPVSDTYAHEDLLYHLRQILSCPAHSPKLKRKCRNLLRRPPEPAHCPMNEKIEHISSREQNDQITRDAISRPSIAETAPTIGSSRNTNHQSDTAHRPRTDASSQLASVFGRHQSTIPPPEFYPQRGQHHHSRVQANGSPLSKRKGKQKASDALLQPGKRISPQRAASPVSSPNIRQLPRPQISQPNPKNPATKPVDPQQPLAASRDDRRLSNPPNPSPQNRILQEISSFNAWRIRHRSLPAKTPTLPPPNHALGTNTTTNPPPTAPTSLIHQAIEAALHQKCTEPVETLKTMVRDMASQLASLTALPPPPPPAPPGPSSSSSPMINTLTLDDYPAQGGSHTFREALEIWRGPGNARTKRQRAPEVFCARGRFRREYRPVCRFLREGEWEMY